MNDTFSDIIFFKCVNLLFCQFKTWLETNTTLKTTTEANKNVVKWKITVSFSYVILGVYLNFCDLLSFP